MVAINPERPDNVIEIAGLTRTFGAKAALADVQSRHPHLTDAGTGAAAPGWIVAAQRGVKRFVQWAP